MCRPSGQVPTPSNNAVVSGVVSEIFTGRWRARSGWSASHADVTWSKKCFEKRSTETIGRDECGFTICGTLPVPKPLPRGAALVDVMARLGRSTVSAAMRYQHAANSRDAAVADALSALAGVGLSGG
jgi:hypothetical protein